MLRRLFCVLVAALASGFFITATTSNATAGSRDNEYSLSPKAPRGERWRIGYYEGGQYADYEAILKATVRGLIKLGWMEPLDMAQENDPVPGAFWAYLSKNAKSQFIEFVPDGYHAAGNFDPAKRPVVRTEL